MAPDYGDYNDDPEFIELMRELDELNIQGDVQMNEEEFQRLMEELEMQNRADEGLEDIPRQDSLVPYRGPSAPRSSRRSVPTESLRKAGPKRRITPENIPSIPRRSLGQLGQAPPPTYTVAPAARAFMAANKPSLPLLNDKYASMTFQQLLLNRIYFSDYLLPFASAQYLPCFRCFPVVSDSLP
jgi:hypothetical protein